MTQHTTGRTLAVVVVRRLRDRPRGIVEDTRADGQIQRVEAQVRARQPGVAVVLVALGPPGNWALRATGRGLRGCGGAAPEAEPRKHARAPRGRLGGARGPGGGAGHGMERRLGPLHLRGPGREGTRARGGEREQGGVAGERHSWPAKGKKTRRKNL